jgi:hypothetical protein
MNTQPYPVMTEEFVQPRISPYDPTLQDAKELLPRLDEAAQRLATAISAKRYQAINVDNVKKALADTEAIVVFEAEIDPSGPLKGIAKTSKAYGYAIDALLAKSPSVNHQRGKLLAATTDYETACIEYDQAETLYNALKYKAGLLSAILVASRG